MKGRVYCHRPDFEPSPGWIGVVKGAIYFKPGAEKGEAAARSLGDSQFEILRLDTDRLAVADSHIVKSGSHVTFSDGNHLGVVTVTNSDNFVVKWFALTPGSPTTTCVQVGQHNQAANLTESSSTARAFGLLAGPSTETGEEVRGRFRRLHH